jgi:hypothetical protein
VNATAEPNPCFDGAKLANKLIKRCSDGAEDPGAEEAGPFEYQQRQSKEGSCSRASGSP